METDMSHGSSRPTITNRIGSPDCSSTYVPDADANKAIELARFDFAAQREKEARSVVAFLNEAMWPGAGDHYLNALRVLTAADPETFDDIEDDADEEGQSYEEWLTECAIDDKRMGE